MIYLHMDKRYHRPRWHERFEFLFARQGITYKKVNLLRKDFGKLKPSGTDALIGRFGHNRRDLCKIKPIYSDIAAHFGGRTFPNANAYYYYDDKQRQLELFQAKGYPTPNSAFIQSRDDAERFLDESGLDFPLITKRLYGASSSQVHLAGSIEELYMPGIVQEYCKHNDGDVRIVVIGNRVMGFLRHNRPGDFRASGSGLLEYVDELDHECVQIAYDISCENGFESMAYDFVVDNTGRWVVLECSYCYTDAAVRDCRYYYEMPSGKKVDKGDVYPEDYILEDFLRKYPVIVGATRRSGSVRRPFWLVRQRACGSERTTPGIA